MKFIKSTLSVLTLLCTSLALAEKSPISIANMDKKVNIRFQPFSAIMGNISGGAVFHATETVALEVYGHNSSFDLNYKDKQLSFGQMFVGGAAKLHFNSCTTDSPYISAGFDYQEEHSQVLKTVNKPIFFTRTTDNINNSYQMTCHRTPFLLGYQWLYDSGFNISWDFGVAIKYNVDIKKLQGDLSFQKAMKLSSTSNSPTSNFSVGYML